MVEGGVARPIVHVNVCVPEGNVNVSDHGDGLDQHHHHQRLLVALWNPLEPIYGSIVGKICPLVVALMLSNHSTIKPSLLQYYSL
jgi:hypothetical protein